MEKMRYWFSLATCEYTSTSADCRVTIPQSWVSEAGTDTLATNVPGRDVQPLACVCQDKTNLCGIDARRVGYSKKGDLAEDVSATHSSTYQFTHDECRDSSKKVQADRKPP